VSTNINRNLDSAFGEQMSPENGRKDQDVNSGYEYLPDSLDAAAADNLDAAANKSGGTSGGNVESGGNLTAVKSTNSAPTPTKKNAENLGNSASDQTYRSQSAMKAPDSPHKNVPEGSKADLLNESVDEKTPRNYPPSGTSDDGSAKE
jgi:hypothetical protein